MFDDIGGKIKGLANFVCWAGIILSVIGGFILVSIGDEFIIVGIVVAILGSVGSWLGSLALYGFGQLIYTNERILAKLNTLNTDSSSTVDVCSEQPTPNINSNKGVAHRWMCDSCKNMIDKEICPFCGKAHGKAAESIESLQRLLNNGIITLEDYNSRLEAIRRGQD